MRKMKKIKKRNEKIMLLRSITKKEDVISSAAIQNILKTKKYFHFNP